MSGGFEVSGREVLEGIPVLLNGDPVKPTLVCTQDMIRFRNWCRASQVNPRSAHVAYIPQVDPVPSRVLMGTSGFYKWVVFVAMDPRDYNVRGDNMTRLNNMRTSGEFDRAWVYPHLWIEPQMYDNGATLDEEYGKNS